MGKIWSASWQGKIKKICTMFSQFTHHHFCTFCQNAGLLKSGRWKICHSSATCTGCGTSFIVQMAHDEHFNLMLKSYFLCENWAFDWLLPCKVGSYLGHVFMVLFVCWLQISELTHVNLPVMLMPDDFKAHTKIRIDNHLFNK